MSMVRAVTTQYALRCWHDASWLGFEREKEAGAALRDFVCRLLRVNWGNSSSLRTYSDAGMSITNSLIILFVVPLKKPSRSGPSNPLSQALIRDGQLVDCAPLHCTDPGSHVISNKDVSPVLKAKQSSV